MIAGEDHDMPGVDMRPGVALPGGEETGDVLEPAERAGRLSQLRLTGARGRSRDSIGARYRGERVVKGRDIGKKRHSATYPAGGTRTMK